MKKSLMLLASVAILAMALAACTTKKEESTSSSKNNSSGERSEKSLVLGETLPNAELDDDETAALQKLYEAAVAEMKEDNGTLIVWAGGDEPTQQQALENAFKQRFPEVPIEIKVDLSKYHDVKIDEQLERNELEPDVTMLQTTQDFDNWKEEGVLESYKPIGFSEQREGYADADGNYMTSFIFSFVPQVTKGLGEFTSYEDLLQPEFQDKLVLTYPHDDDAVLYVYDKIIQKYGDSFLERLAALNPTFLRGTAAPAALVGRENFAGNITGYLQGADSPSEGFIPTEDPFITWTQRAAMFKQTKHKNAAQLFLSYLSSKEYQSATQIWPTRKDLKAQAPFKELEDYPNTDFNDFNNWMKDRQHIAELSEKMESYFGSVKGESPLTDQALLNRMNAEEK